MQDKGAMPDSAAMARAATASAAIEGGGGMSGHSNGIRAVPSLASPPTRRLRSPMPRVLS